MSSNLIVDHFGRIAQSVERETENLCVGGSIPPPTVVYNKYGKLVKW